MKASIRPAPLVLSGLAVVGVVPHFAAGGVRFQNTVYAEKKELYERLSERQSPEALFITCSDSRIATAMITQTRPGALFICRNAGSIVPPHTHYTGGMTAPIEFAVAALNVPHIVVCGHTECGATKRSMNPEELNSLPHVKEWLAQLARILQQLVRKNWLIARWGGLPRANCVLVGARPSGRLAVISVSVKDLSGDGVYCRAKKNPEPIKDSARAQQTDAIFWLVTDGRRCRQCNCACHTAVGT